jgi:hypothetical protein
MTVISMKEWLRGMQMRKTAPHPDAAKALDVLLGATDQLDGLELRGVAAAALVFAAAIIEFEAEQKGRSIANGFAKAAFYFKQLADSAHDEDFQ